MELWGSTGCPGIFGPIPSAGLDESLKLYVSGDEESTFQPEDRRHGLPQR